MWPFMSTAFKVGNHVRAKQGVTNWWNVVWMWTEHSILVDQSTAAENILYEVNDSSSVTWSSVESSHTFIFIIKVQAVYQKRD